jgi:hypothetical protein
MPNEISEIVGTKVVGRSADFLLADGKSGQFNGAMTQNFGRQVYKNTPRNNSADC